VQVGAALKLRVVAEGVETAEQAMALIDAGCHLGQGWYFGKPVPAAAFEQALQPDAPLPEAA
jgi:EAL domain-containing protein (putative c-di-GMP-specific phosphodiesterase class I)